MEMNRFDQSPQYTNEELFDRLQALESENYQLRKSYQKIEFQNVVMENVIQELGLTNDESVDEVISKNNFSELYDSLLEAAQTLDALREIEKQYRTIYNSFIGRKIMWLWNFYYRLRS